MNPNESQTGSTVNSHPYVGNPYVGPRALVLGEALFGRDRELHTLLNLMIAERIVLLCSPSGAGKTSLIQAGLIPALEQEGFECLPVIRVGWPTDGEGSQNRYLNSLHTSLHGILTSAEDLNAHVEAARCHPDRENIVLVFDQFEEILTVNPDDVEGKSQFFNEVGKILRDTSRWALFSMREEFVEALGPYLRDIPNLLRNRLRIDMLEKDAARAAIQKPSERAQVVFEDQAAQKLIEDLSTVTEQDERGQPVIRSGRFVEPVQLQVVCQNLWERTRPDPVRITTDDVETFGRVDEALGRYYAEVVGKAANDTASPRRIRKWIEQHLLNRDGIRVPVLQGVGQTEGLDNHVIDVLTNAHLIRPEKRQGKTWYELAHDRLVQPVLAINQKGTDDLAHVQAAAERWDRQGRPTDRLLLRDADLRDAQSWLERFPSDVTELERTFVKTAQKAEQDVLDQQKLEEMQHLNEITTRENTWLRRDQGRLVWIRGLTVFFGIAAVIAVFGWNNAREQEFVARQQGSAATIRYWAATAANRRPNSGLLIAAEALQHALHLKGSETRATLVEEARDALYRVMQSARSVAYTPDEAFNGHTESVTGVAFSADGSLLATASLDKTLQIWDAKQEKNLITLDYKSEKYVITVKGKRQETEISADLDPITAILFTSIKKEHRLIFAQGKNLLMIDLEEIDPKPKKIKIFQQNISSIALNTSNKQVFVGFSTRAFDNQPEKIAIVNLDGKTVTLNSRTKLSGTVKSIAFSRKDQYLATAVSGKKGGVYLWKLNPNGYELDRVFWEGLSINSLKFSSQNSWIAAGGDENKVYLLNFRKYINDGSVEVINISDSNVDSESVAKYNLFNPSIQDLAFSQDEKILAVGRYGYSNTGTLIDPFDAENSIKVLPASENSILSLVFDPSGQTLITGSNDGKLRVYPIGEDNDQLIASAMKLVRREDKILSDADCQNPPINPCPTPLLELWRKK
jgi:WD40 repeat protein